MLYGVFGSSLLIESTDSNIRVWKNLFVRKVTPFLKSYHIL